MTRALAQHTAPYASALITPRPGPDVCDHCFDLIAPGDVCWSCSRGGNPRLDAFAPISYTTAGTPLYSALIDYKHPERPAASGLANNLTALLRRFLEAHEHCLAAGAQAPGAGFDVISTVPAGDRRSDDVHPLHRLVAAADPRHARLLARAAPQTTPHRFDAARYRATTDLKDTAVLLIDDIWTTGASMHAAAVALRAAGARTVAGVVIGRYVNRGWDANATRLETLAGHFVWERCAIHARGRRVPSAV